MCTIAIQHGPLSKMEVGSKPPQVIGAPKLISNAKKVWRNKSNRQIPSFGKKILSMCRMSCRNCNVLLACMRCQTTVLISTVGH